MKTAVKGLVIGATGVLVGYKVYKKIREKQAEKIVNDAKTMAEEIIQQFEEMENK